MKRCDCPLVTLGLVFDGSGFIRRSKTFAGNVSEGTTLEVMLSGLGAPLGAMVIMDAGMGSEANVTWLSEHGYRYLVVQRGGMRQLMQPVRCPSRRPAASLGAELTHGRNLAVAESSLTLPPDHHHEALMLSLFGKYRDFVFVIASFQVINQKLFSNTVTRIFDSIWG